MSKNKEFIKTVKLIRWVAVIISILLLIKNSGKIEMDVLIAFLVVNIGTIIIGHDYKKNNQNKKSKSNTFLENGTEGLKDKEQSE